MAPLHARVWKDCTEVYRVKPVGCSVRDGKLRNAQ